MKKSWQRLVVVFTTVLFTSVPSFLQAAEGVKKEGRFTVNAEGTPWMTDEPKLLRKFDLHLQWWTLLGEPIEYYDFRWYLNDHYWLPDGSGKITRNELKKYPDLLKRFDAIRPRKVDLLITGNFSNEDKGKKTAPPVLAPFYSRGNYKFLRTEFAYFIPDRKLMITRSGEVGHGIVPGSPWDWDEFLQYKVFYGAIMFESLVKDNNSLRNGAEELDESSLQYRRKQLREVFRDATKVELFVEIANIEWPMNELQAIAKRLREYENGEREPTPQEVVRERVEEEAGSLAEYSKDDFWSMPDPELDPRIETYKVGDKKGVRNKSTGETIVPPGKFDALRVIGEKYIVTEESVVDLRNCEERFTERVSMGVLRDARGAVKIATKFATHTARINGEKQIVVDRPRCYESVEVERDVAPGQWYMPEHRRYHRGTRFTYGPGAFSVVESEPYRESFHTLLRDALER